MTLPLRVEEVRGCIIGQVEVVECYQLIDGQHGHYLISNENPDEEMPTGCERVIMACEYGLVIDNIIERDERHAANERFEAMARDYEQLAKGAG